MRGKALLQAEKSFITQTGIIFVVLALIPLISSGEFFVSTLCLSVIWAIMGIGWNIIGGYAGQVSNGHAMYFAVGAYVGALGLEWFGMSPWITMWVGVLLSMLLAFLIGYPLLRLRGHYFAIATMAIVECVRIICTNWNLIGGATGVSFFQRDMNSLYSLQFENRVPFYFICLGFMLVFIIVSRVIQQSKFGYYCRAIKANQDSAESAGVNSTFYKRWAYMISAAVVSIGGALYAQYIQYIDPVSLLPLSNSMLIVLIVVMGGIGTIWGPVLGAFIMTFINQYARALFNQLSGLNLFIYGVLCLFIVLFIPKGIISLFSGEKIKKLFRKTASEKRR
ncbi:MAG TPA: branched-chain amino acid ABC transporter permease [Candidatus Egerieimonas intestinavium]|uniref:Branched-chain amino acid ABC transporter permease n=1 Tax=Candidatus Egerieimonas intestinavium TaxID=2840777 RepID=A0A9D1EJA0_9FIRM|nr:branched-chain amino acid ABC transporter permease [Candidatus Egerieimonas intestinavium]